MDTHMATTDYRWALSSYRIPNLNLLIDLGVIFSMASGVGSGGFDVEAQESFLRTGLAEATGTTTHINANARKILFKLILLSRSTKLFKLAAADVWSSSSSDYGIIESPQQQHVLIQGSGDGAVAEIPLEVISSSSTADENEQNSLLQAKNINDIVREKDVDELDRYGGAKGIAELLRTDLENGLSTFSQAKIISDSSRIGQIYKMISLFLRSLLVSCNNYTVFLLSIAAILSLFFGINKEGLTNGWFDAAVILFTVIALVVFPTMLSYWRKRMSVDKLGNCWESKGRMLTARVVRGGCLVSVPAVGLQVGDIVFLRKGDQVPGDGIFAGGQPLELDNGLMEATTIDESNPFILYPSRVTNGDAKMIVTATGMDTVWGEKLSHAVQSLDNKSMFEVCFHKVNDCIHATGLLISILIIVVLFLRFKVGKLDDENGSYRPDPKGEPTRVKTILKVIKGTLTSSKGTSRVLTTLLGVSLLGIMEGLPFVICIAIIIWNRKGLGHKASVRDYLACVKMASVTTICSDRFGVLSDQEFVVDKFSIGGELISDSSVIASNVLEGLCDGIRTLFLIRRSGCCGQTLDQLITWAEAKLGMKEGLVSEQCSIINDECCNPFQQCCQVVMDKGENEGQRKYCFYLGPPQHILYLCSHYYDIEGKIQELDGNKRSVFGQDIEPMLAEGTQMIAYAKERLNDCDAWAIQPNHIIFMGMVGLKDTKREDIKTAFSKLTEAGIRTIIVSGDDVEVLKNGGIPDPAESGGLVLTAKEFRDWTDEEKMERVERICMMGNCLLADKILLIKYLQEKSQVVALVAQQTMDVPALVQANVGLAFGTWSSEIAREYCDISIWDGCYLGLVANAVESGRCFQENVRKFIQLQLIVTISSSSINFTATVVLGDSPITTVQLFWLNLVLAFVGGLALLTRPPTEATMAKSAVMNATHKLITKAMWRNIAIQASYQTTVFVVLLHKGQFILGISGDRVKSMIYNGFFLCQVFNKIIAREPEKKNIFRGLCQEKHPWFWVALFLTLVCQAGFAAAEKALGCSPGLKWKLWGGCFLIGLVSWLLDWVGKIVIKCNVHVV